MRIKTFFTCVLLASALITGAPEMAAQKRTGTKKSTTSTARKSTTRKSTTSTTPKSTTSTTRRSAALAGSMLNKEMFEKYNAYWGWVDMDNEQSNMFMGITFNGNEMEVDLNMVQIPGTWRVTGCELSLSGGNMNIKANSNDDGKYFVGTMFSNGKTNYVYLYNISDAAAQEEGFNLDKVKKMLISGGYDTYLMMSWGNSKPILGTSVTTKFTPDGGDENAGTFKVTGEGRILQYLGAVKQTYEWKGNDLYTSKVDGGELDKTPFFEGDTAWNGNHFRLDLGHKNIPGFGDVELWLYFVTK